MWRRHGQSETDLFPVAGQSAQPNRTQACDSTAVGRSLASRRRASDWRSCVPEGATRSKTRRRRHKQTNDATTTTRRRRSQALATAVSAPRRGNGPNHTPSRGPVRPGRATGPQRQRLPARSRCARPTPVNYSFVRSSSRPSRGETTDLYVCMRYDTIRYEMLF